MRASMGRARRGAATENPYTNGFPFAREIAVHICNICFQLMFVALETNHLFRIAAFPDTAGKW